MKFTIEFDVPDELCQRVYDERGADGTAPTVTYMHNEVVDYVGNLFGCVPAKYREETE